jgi:tetratricopeptide (TPR) repeat protein
VKRGWGLTAAACAVFAVAVLGGTNAAGAQQDGDDVEPFSCDVADAFAEVGRTEAAIRAYESVLRRDPESDCARDGIAEVTSTTTTKPADQVAAEACAAAERLIEADADDAARTLLQDTLKASDAECATDLLDELNDDSALDTVEGAVESGTSWLAVAGTILGWLLAAGAIIALFAILLSGRARDWTRVWLQRRMGQQLVFGPFVDSDGAKTGAPIEAMVEAHHHWLSGADPAGGRIDVVDAHSELSTVGDDLAELAPQLASAGAVMRLVERWVRPHRWTISGQVLAADTATGPGLAVRFSESGRLAHGTVFRHAREQPDGDATEPHYLRLALPAAAWTAHHLAAKRDVDTTSKTASATSYAWLVAAADAHLHGDLPNAIDYYERAVEEDDGHMRARVGRALATAQWTDSRAHELFVLETTLREVEAHLDV